jgi:hypothetical protein
MFAAQLGAIGGLAAAMLAAATPGAATLRATSS